MCVVSQTLLPNLHRSTQFTWFHTQSCRAFTDPHNLCGSSQPGSLYHSLNLLLWSSSLNCSSSRTWLLFNDTIQWLSVWLTPCDFGRTPSEWTGPVPVHSSPVVIWTSPIPVQKSLGLDWTEPGLVESLLTSLPFLVSGVKTSSLCSGSSPGSSSDLWLKLWQ